ncbi:DUF5695 domain-containing protein [Hephaestia mangrovi]|uniref:DUF5695 domain-containing protein n=1 Tax=Hephaestia mangrovi TaxID=2873268 RepID=UPI002103BE0E|nr:DUF5695 domain-containing protein [Hephaestia mangrovi]
MARQSMLVASLFALGGAAPPIDTSRGAIMLSTPTLSARLDARTQTLVSLVPRSTPGFDFTPYDLEKQRNSDGYYHLGDIDLRLRSAGGVWRDYSSAFHKGAVGALPTGNGVLAAADLAACFPADIPLDVQRRWMLSDGTLALRFRLTNRSSRPVEIGGLGLPMVFDNILTDRTLEQAHNRLSFADPYIGRDAGYLQVTRLNGEGPALLVLPERHTPFEAYKPILDQTGPGGTPKIFNDPTKRGTTFEGLYDWMVATRGFADKEWKGVREWNSPTAFTLAPGESREIGVRFVLSPSIRGIEDTLAKNDRPVAVGIPGYVLPTDLPADLFLKAPQRIAAMSVEPRGAITVTPASSRNGWAHYRVQGHQWGRARLTIRYVGGEAQTVSYFVTKPERQAVADMGRFLFTRQWFDDTSDPFHRAPSIISYDHDEGRQVLQDQRVWIAGLSDEGGAGSWLAAIMKQLGEPDPAEVAKFEQFVTGTLDGRLQVNQGPDCYGVRKSLFYYDPKAQPNFRYDPSIDWKSWSAWDRKQAYSVGRSFNYVHVAAAYWVLYRLARYHVGLVHAHDWRWYLTHAAETAVAMQRLAPDYAKFGQMEGNVFVSILRDLKREGMTAEAASVEQVMRARAERWAHEAYPFGSEMPWDSTGQPEVYAWMRYFGDDAKAAQTREVILGYDPTIPSWGYNGSARRYWDFNYAGKTRRIERQLHHYGSSNNALPLFAAYRRDPTDFHLLRVAYGGLMGPITNIAEDGFGSAAFHSYPDMMRFDGYSGDYGTNFFGVAFGTASYLVDHPVFGWLGFGGIVAQHGDTVSITPRDSFRSRVFIAPAGLWLTLRAGSFTQVDYDRHTGRVRLHLAARDRYTPAAVLEVSTTTATGRPYRPATALKRDPGGWHIPLPQGGTTIDLLPGRRR